MSRILQNFNQEYSKTRYLHTALCSPDLSKSCCNPWELLGHFGVLSVVNWCCGLATQFSAKKDRANLYKSQVCTCLLVILQDFLDELDINMGVSVYVVLVPPSYILGYHLTYCNAPFIGFDIFDAADICMNSWCENHPSTTWSNSNIQYLST